MIFICFYSWSLFFRLGYVFMGGLGFVFLIRIFFHLFKHPIEIPILKFPLLCLSHVYNSWLYPRLDALIFIRGFPICVSFELSMNLIRKITGVNWGRGGIFSRAYDTFRRISVVLLFSFLYIWISFSREYLRYRDFLLRVFDIEIFTRRPLMLVLRGFDIDISYF